MNGVELWSLLRRRWLTVVVVTAVSLLAGGAATAFMPKKYASEALLYVSAVGAEDAGSLAQGTTFIQSQIKSYPTLVTAPTVLEKVRELSGTAAGTGDLASRVTTTVPTDSTLMRLVVQGEDPAQAAELASAFATAVIQEITRLETRPDSKVTPVRVALVDQPVAPSGPVSPSPIPILAAAGLLGVLIGLAVAVILDRIRKPDA